MSAPNEQPGAQQGAPEAGSQEARADTLRKHLEAATAQAMASARALDVANMNTAQVAAELRAAQEPSLAANLANGAAWAAGAALVAVGLNALASYLARRQPPAPCTPYRERGTVEAATEPAAPK